MVDEAVAGGGDTIARIGGDEFAVVQVELRTPTDAATLADRLMTAASAPRGSKNSISLTR